MSIRIAQFLLSERVGGAERVAEILHAQLQLLGVESHVIYLDPRVGSASRWHRIKRSREQFAALQPDVIFAHSKIPAIYARLAAGTIPVVPVLHSASPEFGDWAARVVENILFWRTAEVVSVSKRNAEEYVSRVLLHRHVSVIENGVEQNISSIIRPHSEDINIITLARVSGAKDPETWLLAANGVVDERPNARFRWYGPVERDFEPLIRSVTGPRIRFMGPTDNSEAVIAAADLMFHSSRIEASPMAIREALVAGLPVVCADSVASLFPPELAIRSFKNGDVDDAKSVLCSALDSILELQEYGQLNIPKAMKLFSAGNMANAYMSVAIRNSR